MSTAFQFCLWFSCLIAAFLLVFSWCAGQQGDIRAQQHSQCVCVIVDGKPDFGEWSSFLYGLAAWLQLFCWCAHGGQGTRETFCLRSKTYVGTHRLSGLISRFCGHMQLSTSHPASILFIVFFASHLCRILEYRAKSPSCGVYRDI